LAGVIEEELELRDTFLVRRPAAARLRSRRRIAAHGPAPCLGGTAATHLARTWHERTRRPELRRRTQLRAAGEQSRRRAGADRAPDRRGPACSGSAGGLAYEREVSLSSGRRVADALHRAGADALIVDADADLVSRLTTTRPDAVFIALHGSSVRTGRCAACWTCSTCVCRQQRGSRPVPPGTSRREGRGAGGRPRHAGLGGAAADDVPGARRGWGARSG